MIRMRDRPPEDLPTLRQLETELAREKDCRRYGRILQSTACMLLMAAAAAVLAATLWLPVLRICGASMAPTLSAGEIVVARKGADVRCGDVIAFYYNNKILVKRVIAGPGQWVDMEDDGTVRVDGDPLDEPYLAEKAPGSCDISLPYQVPDGRFFVMGDHRAVSVDSRHSAIGCVAEEQIVGRVVLRVWPLSSLGGIA